MGLEVHLTEWGEDYLRPWDHTLASTYLRIVLKVLSTKKTLACPLDTLNIVFYKTESSLGFESFPRKTYRVKRKHIPARNGRHHWSRRHLPWRPCSRFCSTGQSRHWTTCHKMHGKIHSVPLGIGKTLDNLITEPIQGAAGQISVIQQKALGNIYRIHNIRHKTL